MQSKKRKISSLYASKGRAGLSVRLMSGLHILKQMYHLSDEGVCERWEHGPYFQYFFGEYYFQHQFPIPIERSSMSHFRKRVGEGFFISLLQESLHNVHQLGALKTKHVKRVVTDTTVQLKAVTFPTDAKLRYQGIIRLSALSKKWGLHLRQS